MEAIANTTQILAPRLDKALPKKRGTRPTKAMSVRPFTRDMVDSRLKSAKIWDSLAANIIADAGGESEISTIQRTLIDAFCGVAIQLADLNTKSLLGQPVDLTELSLASSTLVRLASRIGITRVPREVGPSLGDLLRDDLRKQREEQAS